MTRIMPYWAIWLIGLVVVVGFWAISWYLVIFSKSNLALQIKNSNIDVFSAISTLFSGLVFLAVVVTLISQIRSITLSKRDLEERQFETNFFRLIEVHDRILNNIEKSIPTAYGMNVQRGRQVMKYYYDTLITTYNEIQTIDEPSSRIQKAYHNFFEGAKPDLGHYFRHLYHIIKFIDRSKIKNKQTYVNLLRAQLSTYEQLLLFYNCLSEYGIDKFKKLVENYALLENMPDDTLDKANKEQFSHRSLYKPSAFDEAKINPANTRSTGRETMEA